MIKFCRDLVEKWPKTVFWFWKHSWNSTEIKLQSMLFFINFHLHQKELEIKFNNIKFCVAFCQMLLGFVHFWTRDKNKFCCCTKLFHDRDIRAYNIPPMISLKNYIGLKLSSSISERKMLCRKSIGKLLITVFIKL